MALKKIIILHDVINDPESLDGKDTLQQRELIHVALAERGYQPEFMEFQLNLEAMMDQLREAQAYAVFNVVEMVDGSDELCYFAPLILERLRLPFTGCGSRAMILSNDKPLAKRLMRAAGIPTPDWMEGEALFDKTALDGPYIYKATDQGGSLGLEPRSVAYTRDQLMSLAWDRAECYGGRWFAERFLDGREFTVPMLDTPDGPVIPAIAEICFSAAFPQGQPRIVDFAAKWIEDSVECRETYHSFELEDCGDAFITQLKDISLRAWNYFGFTGYARLDFRTDESGQPFLLEINSNPYLHPHTSFLSSLAHAGMDFAEVVEQMVENAQPKSPYGST